MSPASFCGMPLQIFMDGSTAGVEHLSGAKLSRFEIGVGLRTHSRSCSDETIQAVQHRIAHQRKAARLKGEKRRRTVRLLLGPVEEVVDHLDSRSRRSGPGYRELTAKISMSSLVALAESAKRTETWIGCV